MKKLLGIILAITMIISVVLSAAVYADEAPAITYTDHLTGNSEYDVTGASIAWVKQATGALVWVAADDARTDDEIIDAAKAADPSLANSVRNFAVLRGLGSAQTPNGNGSKALVTVAEAEGATILSISGNYSHFVSGTPVAAADDTTAETEVPAGNGAATGSGAQGETVSIRIDVPLKMAVAFADGTVYYGGEMKDVVVGQEYMFRMCSVNWDNGIYDEDNGLAGTVVYRMTAVHQNEFKALAAQALQDPDRYTVKGIDIIDNVEKTIIVNCDAADTHLETDVNNFFVAYRFHFTSSDYNRKTGIEKVVNTPVESLSVNLPAGTTVTCSAYYGEELLGTDYVFITTNSGEGIYESVYLTSVNDYTWAY
ncbi:MAG: hypothetical protein J5585_09085 [Clostridia bacterium]|nr:hypothetical protein [Clostridia bacterium]